MSALALIQKGAARLGLGCVRAELADGRERREAWAEAFDVVLCDVPCSGLGLGPAASAAPRAAASWI